MKKQPQPEDTLKQGSVERFTPDQKVPPLRSTSLAIDIKWAENIEAPKPSQYLIKGIIEPRQVSIWFGPPGTAKTFLLLYLGHAIAKGREVFGRRVCQARTLYIALEGRGGIDKRIFALCKTMGDAPDFGYSGTAIEMLTTDRSGARINAEHMESLTKTIRDNGIKLVIIDTMNLTLGGADENDNSLMGQLMKAAGEIAQTTGAHIAFIAHSGKNTERGTRGASAQKGNADLVVAISGEQIFTASCDAPAGKIKDGATFKLYFRLKVEDLAPDGEGGQITSCTVEETEAPKAPKADTSLKLTQTEQGWLTDLEQMFQETGPNAPMKREPLPGLTCLTLTRDQVREGYKRKGRLGDVSADGAIENKYRTQLNAYLSGLKDKGKINMTDKQIWLID